MLGITQVYAQNRTITGTVTSKDDGLPLPGVSVTVTGTTIGTQTNVTGKFTLSVPATAKSLSFSFIGFAKQDIAIGASDVVNASLGSSAAQLSEVLVTGVAGIRTSSRAGTTSAQVVGGTQLNTVRQTNLNNALAGKVAGIQVRSQSVAALGRQTEVRLRGASGFGAGRGALYVVDGTVLQNSDDLNPDDIEDVSILQGPAASAQFGSQGANGVIVITTKKAKKNGGVGIDVNLGAQFDKVYILPNYQNEYGGGANADFTQYNWQAGQPEGWKALSGKYYPDYSDDSSWGPRMVGQEYIPWYAWAAGSPYAFKTATWDPQPNSASDYYQTGITLNNNIVFNKAGEDYNFKMGYGNQYIQGIVPTQDLRKNTLNLNGNYDLSKHLTLSTNINYINQKVRGEINDAYGNQTSGSFSSWYHRDIDMNIMKELRGLKSPEGVFVSWNHLNPSAYLSDPAGFYAGNYWYNFYTYQDYYKQVNNRDRIYGNIALTYKINSDLSLKGTYRKNQTTTWEEVREYSELKYSQTQTGRKGKYNTLSTNSNRENYEFLASYNKKINDFSVNANVGSDTYNWTYKENGGNTVDGLGIDNLFTLGNSVSPITIFNQRINEKYNAVYGNVQVGYKETYFLTGSLRNDWYSTLPKDDNAVLSKSIGGSFVFSELLKDQADWLSFGKLRASWGEIPNALGINNETFGYYRYPGMAYAVNANKFNGNILMGTPDQFVDPTIHGAVSTQKEIGFDLRFLNDRVGLKATYWMGEDKDYPTTLNVNGASGFSSVLTNIGLIQRKGLDLNLEATPVSLPNFRWTVNATYSNLIANTVVEISDKYKVDQYRVTDGGNTFGAVPYLLHAKGKEWGQIYGNGILRNAAGVPILSATGFYQNNPNVFFGSVLPKHTGGLQNSFSIFKDFTLNVNIDYQFGGKFASLSNVWGSFSGLTARTAGLNDKGNPIRDAVADGGGVHTTGVDADGNAVSFYVNAKDYYQGLYNNNTFDEFVYDLTFVKLRELSIGYRIPTAKLGISKFVKSANFSLVGRDLLLLYTKTKDFDPSQISAVQGESGQLPGTRAIGFNLRLSF
jgi:TonB-linked SusC/RagA family outer membrane protein